jgi:two-component system chemotaxis sensor kinase CheA
MILDPGGIARATGLDARPVGTRRGGALAADARRADLAAAVPRRDGAPKAVPLALVARLEDLAAERIEQAGSGLVTQYRATSCPC